VTTDCLWCDRECPRCGFPIPVGWEHAEQQPPLDGAIVAICHLRRAVRPLIDTLAGYLNHYKHVKAGR